MTSKSWLKSKTMRVRRLIAPLGRCSTYQSICFVHDKPRVTSEVLPVPIVAPLNSNWNIEKVLVQEPLILNDTGQ